MLGNLVADANPEPTLTVLLDPEWAHRALVGDVRSGLGSYPRSLSPHWLYDDKGSDLFDQITRIPEYYPTEAEREILRRESDTIVQLSGADCVVELGAGTSDKTTTLLDAFYRAGRLRSFIPFDVSEAPLHQSSVDLHGRYPGVAVHAIVGDFNHHLSHLPREGHRMIAFLGGTIGNYAPAERAEFLLALAASLRPGEHLLLGTDLVKSADRLIAAYDDPAGITERFIRNSFSVVNRELDADFDQSGFEYVCFWDPTRERVDMRMRSLTTQQVSIPGAQIDFRLEEGEEIRIEISSKFRREGLAAELASAGLELQGFWTDEAGDFALSLSRRIVSGAG